MTNQDTDSHPRVDQWSNGVNQADELNRLMKIRRAALNRLGEHTIRNGAPMATIEEPLVPIYMYHRYAVESTASMVGGMDYIYAMRGDGRTPVKWETAANQRKALDALASTLKPSELDDPRSRCWTPSRRGRRGSDGIANCSRGRPATPSTRSARRPWRPM